MREITYQDKHEIRVGSVGIHAIEQEGDLVKCIVSIQLDMCREIAVYGVDHLQVLKAGLAIIEVA